MAALSRLPSGVSSRIHCRAAPLARHRAGVRGGDPALAPHRAGVRGGDPALAPPPPRGRGGGPAPPPPPPTAPRGGPPVSPPPKPGRRPVRTRPQPRHTAHLD